MHVFVTGGCGFIGSNLIPLLLEKQISVRVLDNLSTGKIESLFGLDVDFQYGDIRDYSTVVNALQGMDAVIHLAAHTSVIDSQRDPVEDFEINTRGTFNLLKACRDIGTQRFVFASSNAPIGDAEPPIDETKAPRPMSPYGASKLAGEGYCSAFFHSYGLKTIALRFANVYGPLSGHKTSVIAQFLRDIVETGHIRVYGDGTQTRDFIHVTDLCQAILASIITDRGGTTYQIATGKETTIIDIIDLIRSCMVDYPFEVDFLEKRPGEIIKNYSEISKVKNELGWQPNIQVSVGIPDTVKWFLDNYSTQTTQN